MKVIDVNSDNQDTEFNKPILEESDYKNLKGMVATPCFGGVIHNGTVSGFLGSLFKAAHNGISLDFRFLNNESLITRARNNLVCQFLVSQSTHLIFVDADIEFIPESLLRLMISDREVVAGAYPVKSFPPRYAIDFSEDAKVDDQGFIKINRAATGFLCIKRSALEKMKKAYPELQYSSDIDAQYGFDGLPAEQQPSEELKQGLKDNLFSFFDTSHDPNTNEYLSEDYTFSERWKKIGGEIWLDTTCHLSHVGNVNYSVSPENINELIQANAKA